MILKFFGAILIILSCTCFGLSIKSLFSMRINELVNLASCIDVFSKEICYSFNNIPDSVNEAMNFSSDNNKKILKKFLENYNNSDGLPVSKIWNNTIDDIAMSGIIYDKKDIEAMRSFGNLLGQGDTELQAKNIEELQVLITKNITNSKEKYNKMSISPKLGIYVGIVIVIILF